MSVVVNRSKAGQFTITVPAHIVELLDLKMGDRVQWFIDPVSRDLIFEKAQQ